MSSLINMALNIIHTHEVAYEYQSAFDVTKKFLTSYPNLAVGELKASTFLAIIAPITKVYDPRLRAGTATDCVPFGSIPEIFDAGQIQVQIPSRML